MRIAIQNPFANACVAETELSHRIYLAAQAIGWQALEVSSAEEIKPFAPDCIILLHHQVPKTTDYPTYCCMWSPPQFFEGRELFVKNILSYDAYLMAAGTINRWLKDLLLHTRKRYFIQLFPTSCHHVPYQVPQLNQPRLAYLGANWDGPRFQEFFVGLDRLDYVDIYGNPDGWTHLQQSYRGALPCDGVSVLHMLNRAGVGLCLHKEQHREAGIPSSRIFEIAASGAIAICGDHPFIRDVFGDSVLYLDSELSVTDQVAQIAHLMDWIRHNRQAALDMSAKAYHIFAEHYTLEQALLNLQFHHQTLVQQKGFLRSGKTESLEFQQFNIGIINSSKHANPHVQFIVRVQDLNRGAIESSLNSIAAQTYPHVSAIVVKPEDTPEIDALLKQYKETLAIRIVDADYSQYRSTPLWAGLNAVDSDYFAILDSGNMIHPNHTFVLMSLLNQCDEIGVAYSGSTELSYANSEGESQGNGEPRELAYFYPFNLDQLLQLNPAIAFNSFIGRSRLLNTAIKLDPELQWATETYLLLCLRQKTDFMFSYEVTCDSKQQDFWLDNRSKPNSWIEEVKRLEFMFWQQEFAPGKTLQTKLSLQAALERLQTEIEQANAQANEFKARVTAMESSKFWKLRAMWFKLKQRVGLPTENE